MRYVLLILLALAGVAWAQTSETPPIYTPIRSDVSPQVRNGRVFVPVRVISEQFNATTQWLPVQQTVVITRSNQPTIRLVIGSTTVRVDDQAVVLDAAPFVYLGRTLVPLRFIAERYDVPVNYESGTRTVRVRANNRLYVLPLDSPRTGVVIETPARSTLQRNPILVQGVANVYEGALTVEVQDARGRVLGSTITTAGMGAFYPFSVPVYYNLPSDDPIDGFLVVYSQNGQGNGRILAQDRISIRLASTI